VKALVQRGDSLIKPRQSQNRISGFSTDYISIYYLLSEALESRVVYRGFGFKVAELCALTNSILNQWLLMLNYFGADDGGFRIE
jgi:hypothetical protein